MNPRRRSRTLRPRPSSRPIPPSSPKTESPRPSATGNGGDDPRPGNPLLGVSGSRCGRRRRASRPGREEGDGRASGGAPLGAPAPGGGGGLCGLPGVPRPRAEADPRGDAEAPRQEAGLPQADRAVVGPPRLAAAGGRLGRPPASRARRGRRGGGGEVGAAPPPGAGGGLAALPGAAGQAGADARHRPRRRRPSPRPSRPGRRRRPSPTPSRRPRRPGRRRDAGRRGGTT